MVIVTGGYGGESVRFPRPVRDGAGYRPPRCRPRAEASRARLGAPEAPEISSRRTASRGGPPAGYVAQETAIAYPRGPGAPPA